MSSEEWQRIAFLLGPWVSGLILPAPAEFGSRTRFRLSGASLTFCCKVSCFARSVVLYESIMSILTPCIAVRQLLFMVPGRQETIALRRSRVVSHVDG